MEVENTAIQIRINKLNLILKSPDNIEKPEFVNHNIAFLEYKNSKFFINSKPYKFSKELQFLNIKEFESFSFIDNNSIEIIGVLKADIEQELFSKEDGSNNETTISKLKSLVSKIISSIKSIESKDIFTCDISSFSSSFQELLILQFLEQNYSFEKYKPIIENSDNNNYDNSYHKPLLEIITNLNDEKIQQIEILSSNISYCKNLINSNADEITSKYLHKELEEFSKKHSLKFKAIVGEELLKERMNLHYQVGKSAQVAPRMLYAIYNGDSKSKNYTTLVGKGVTFDTGGINLKPTGAIEDMKLDMGGAATVLSVFKTLVKMNIKKNVIVVLGCCENSIDSKSYKPGDVFISRKGISVEITNTDAEGRLVLADCMDYIQDTYTVHELIDCATLTGASMIALGLNTIAMFSNDNPFARNIYASSKSTHELMWRLPIFDEHRDVLKSNIAHCSNCGSGALRRYGGASSAAAFLEKFVKEDVKWVHLDIAGASFNSKTGATGVGVKTLVHYLSK